MHAETADPLNQEKYRHAETTDSLHQEKCRHAETTDSLFLGPWRLVTCLQYHMQIACTMYVFYKI